MFKRILVPIDNTAGSRTIQNWVIGLAGPLQAEIVLMTVVNPDKIELPVASARREQPVTHVSSGAVEKAERQYIESAGTGLVVTAPKSDGELERPPAFGTQIVDSAVEQAQSGLQEIAAEIEKEIDQVSVIVEIGDPSTQIVKAATDESVDAIAMATHRESSLARGILGSVTDRVIRSSPVPVLTIRPNGGGKASPVTPGTVVVPLDGSEHSESVVPIAIEISKATGAELVFVQVAATAHYSAMAGAGVYYASPIKLNDITEFAREYLEPFAEKAKQAGVEVSLRTPTGTTAGAIMSVADQSEDAMIVMGTRGNSGLKRWVLGSVTDKVVRASGHPVLVVP